jgi:hygromycin-B 7''-O-kinase
VEELIARAVEALREPFQPCFVMQDYKPDNLAILHENGKWRVSGVFDLMQPYFADGEADLTRTTFVYLNEEPELAREFIRAYSDLKTFRPGFAERFAVYMLDDLAILSCATISIGGRRDGRSATGPNATYRSVRYKRSKPARQSVAG